MTAVAEFANLSLAEVSPGMLTASACDTSRLGPPTAAPVLCTPIIFVEFTVATVELAQAIHNAVTEAG